MRKVHSFAPTIEDWFLVCHIEDKRWMIERVIAWALTQAEEEQTDVLSGFGNQGYIPADTFNYRYVKGSDKCPTGRRWGEIFDEIVPNGVDFREIKDSDLLMQLN